MTFQTPVPDDTDPRAVDALRHQLAAFAHEIDAVPSLHDVLGRRRRQHRQRVAVAAAGAVAAVAVAVPTVGLVSLDGARQAVPARPTSAPRQARPTADPLRTQEPGRLLRNRAAFEAYVTDQIRHARGTIEDQRLARQALTAVLVMQADKPDGRIPRLAWGAPHSDGRQVVVVTVRQRTGAQTAWLFEASGTSVVREGGQTPNPSHPLAPTAVGPVTREGLVAFAVDRAFVVLVPPKGAGFDVFTGGRGAIVADLNDGGRVLDTVSKSVNRNLPVQVFDRFQRVIATGVTR